MLDGQVERELDLDARPEQPAQELLQVVDDAVHVDYAHTGLLLAREGEELPRERSGPFRRRRDLSGVFARVVGQVA